MPAKTFTLTSAGPTAGQVLDATATNVLIRGDMGGGVVQIETSPTDSDYTLVVQVDKATPNATYPVTIPSGWYVRANLLGVVNSSPNLTVVVDGDAGGGGGGGGGGGNSPVSTNTGLVVFRNTAASNTPLAVKAGPGNVYGILVPNTNSNAVYVKFYDLAVGSTTVGTSTVRATMMVPGGNAQNPGMLWASPDIFPILAHFGTAITVAVTANQADNDNTAPASPVQLNVLYV